MFQIPPSPPNPLYKRVFCCPFGEYLRLKMAVRGAKKRPITHAITHILGTLKSVYGIQH